MSPGLALLLELSMLALAICFSVLVMLRLRGI
jgi:hypothetical protein